MTDDSFCLELAEKCREKSDDLTRQESYQYASELLAQKKYSGAAAIFSRISGFADADKQYAFCTRQLRRKRRIYLCAGDAAALFIPCFCWVWDVDPLLHVISVLLGGTFFIILSLWLLVGRFPKFFHTPGDGGKRKLVAAAPGAATKKIAAAAADTPPNYNRVPMIPNLGFLVYKLGKNVIPSAIAAAIGTVVFFLCIPLVRFLWDNLYLFRYFSPGFSFAICCFLPGLVAVLLTCKPLLRKFAPGTPTPPRKTCCLVLLPLILIIASLRGLTIIEILAIPPPVFLGVAFFITCSHQLLADRFPKFFHTPEDGGKRGLSTAAPGAAARQTAAAEPASYPVRCPHCQAELELPSEFIGQEVSCPNCGKSFVGAIPGSAQR